MSEVIMVVPVKPFSQAKTRLSAVLSPAQRAQLARALYLHVLSVLERCRFKRRSLVVSRDLEALELASAHGAHRLRDITSGPNEAIHQGIDWARNHWQANTVCIVPTDLPFLSPEDLDAIVALATGPKVAVLAPSHSGGTNPLLMRPAGAFTCGYGPPGSLARHKAAAQAAGLTVHLYQSRGTAIDLDDPRDLELVRTAGALPPALAALPFLERP
ncbi:MAG: 2-phospho-L-lactate guanylyltransferase [Deinococcus sp.]|nr:2-phospho-L-lactate guanylyltransferase [Deinococcus sp.]